MMNKMQTLAGRFRRLAGRFVPRKPEPPPQPHPDDAAWLTMQKSGWYNSATGEIAPGFPIRSADRVVDIGCSTGNISVFAAKQGADVVGIDIDASAIETLRERFRTQFPVPSASPHSETPPVSRQHEALVSDCNPIPLPADYADVVLVMEVLEHVDDPAAMLREAVRIGKRNARYLFLVPDPLAESVQRVIAPPVYWQRPNHLRVFEREEIQGLVESAGLVVDRKLFDGFYWSMWWFLYWAVPKNSIPPGKTGDSELLRHWNETWISLISTPKGDQIRQALENAMPKSQVLIAHKP
ncbi:MAG: class I SAM-dependent methyltransferase [Thermoguttaceae bacterium]